MPGHGVPQLYSAGTLIRLWFYGYGTSLSTPYLAAAAIIGSYGYNKGYDTILGPKRPSSSLLHTLLKGAASREGVFHTRYGYGYIDLLELYNEAYAKGVADAIADRGPGGGHGGPGGG